MIEAADDGFGCFLDVTVVDEKSFCGIDIPFDNDVEMEGMAVQSAAFVAIGKRRQMVRGLEVEGFGQANKHRAGILVGGCDVFQRYQSSQSLSFRRWGTYSSVT